MSERSKTADVQAPLPAWDPVEASHLLDDLRAQADEQRRSFGGSFPPALATVVSDYVAVAESYVANHEAEAARGWDPMELLAGVRPRLVEFVTRAKQGRRQAG